MVTGEKILKLLKNKDYRFCIMAKYHFYDRLSDEDFIKKKYKAMFETELDLISPKTFNEKLQWLKLHDRKPEYTQMVDKYKVRDYVADKIGDKYLIPLLGVWDNPADINFDKLPNQFVLKCNHNSGLGMYICKDKNNLNIKKIKKQLKKGLEQDYYLTSREWPYKNVERKIICEQYMTDNIGENLTDYKFFCFNGIPKFMYISNDYATNPTTDFFDMNFNRLDMRMKDPNSDNPPSKPRKFDELKRIAEQLSFGIPFVRVDMYVINEQIYFGELTFFHNAGFFKIYPEKWEQILGDWIDIEAV